LQKREHGFVLFHGGVPSPKRKDLIARFKDDDKLKELRFTPDARAETLAATGVFLVQKPGHDPIPVSDVIDLSIGSEPATVRFPVKSTRTFPAGTLVYFALSAIVAAEGAPVPGLVETGIGTRYPTEAV